jgi:hypothetical protein
LCYSENHTKTQTDSVFRTEASIILKRIVLVRAQGYSNPGRQTAVATKFCKVVPNVYDSQNGAFFVSPSGSHNFEMTATFLENVCTAVMNPCILLYPTGLNEPTEVCCCLYTYDAPDACVIPVLRIVFFLWRGILIFLYVYLTDTLCQPLANRIFVSGKPRRRL